MLIGFCQLQQAYLYKDPTFHCYQDNNQSISQICTKAEACSSFFGYFTSSDFVSIATRYELYCDRQWILDYGISFVLFFAGLLAMIFSGLSDIFGRVIFFWVSIYIVIIGSLVTWFDISYQFTFMGQLLIFLGSEIFWSITCIYNSEVISPKLVSQSNSILQFFFSSGNIVFVIFVSFLSSYL